MTGERVHQLGLEFAKKNLPGHQAFVCTHTDGHNESGNIHVHIVINSLHKNDVEHQDFMERAFDSRAENKHHLTDDYLVYLKQSLMDLCLRENLHQVDLLTKAERKVTEKEYHAKRIGQKKLEERNRQMNSDGITPRTTVFQTQKEFLRTSIEQAAASAHNLTEFEQMLLEKCNIRFKIIWGRFSYLYPYRDKFITGMTLGIHYETDYLLKRFEENVVGQDKEKESVDPEWHDTKADDSTVRQSNSVLENPIELLLIKSDLRLVVNIQNCVKAQQSAAYANKVKLSNLKEMAKTMAYIQEHGYDTRDALEDSFAEVKDRASSSRKNLKAIEDKLRATNERLHFTGQYLANKSVYREFCNAKNKGQFRKEYVAEITLYETAQKFLKEHSVDGRLPSMKQLKAEKEQLLQQKEQAQNTYHYYLDYKKELSTVCSNEDLILGQPHSRQIEKQKNIDIS